MVQAVHAGRRNVRIGRDVTQSSSGSHDADGARRSFSGHYDATSANLHIFTAYGSLNQCACLIYSLHFAKFIVV